MMWTFWLAHLFVKVGEKLHQMKVIVRLCQIGKDIFFLLPWWNKHDTMFTIISLVSLQGLRLGYIVVSPCCSILTNLHPCMLQIDKLL
jgi:hypothetical protein